jgi:hypothetical protein
MRSAGQSFLKNSNDKENTRSAAPGFGFDFQTNQEQVFPSVSCLLVVPFMGSGGRGTRSGYGDCLTAVSLRDSMDWRLARPSPAGLDFPGKHRVPGAADNHGWPRFWITVLVSEMPAMV